MRKEMIRVFWMGLGLVVLFMTIPLSDVAHASTNGKIEGNTFKLTAVNDFLPGIIDGVIADESIGDGALMLAAGRTDGEYFSRILHVEPFEYLVASWNADTPNGTYIEVSVRAYVDALGEWSDWVSWGKWGRDIPSASTDDADDLVAMDTDILTVRGTAGETASQMQFKVALHTDNISTSPILRQLAATYKNTLDGQGIKPNYLEEYITLPESVRLNTPAYSQLTRESSIAEVMCSAVTICTLLNDRGEDLMPEEVAMLSYDHRYEGFGNWPFSIGTAGAYGYEAYVQYADLNILRQELAKGYSVGISVRYSSSPEGPYPYLENGAAANTPGHLITVTGYENIDGVDYFYCSDSIALGDANCTRRYRADQLDAAWSNRIAYLVHDKEENTGYAATERKEAELTLKNVNGSSFEYALVVDGQELSLPATYLTQKFETIGRGGIICLSIVGDVIEAVAPPAMITTANSKGSYHVAVTENGTIQLELSTLLNGVPPGENRTLTLYFMGNDGLTYVATVTLQMPG